MTMQAKTSSALDLQAVPEKGGRFTITARCDGESLTDRLTITSARSRAAFIKRLRERWPDLDGAEAERLLEREARTYTEARAQGPGVEADGELDPAMVFRPERFITPDVNGLAFPVIGESGGRPVGRWTLILQWADGHRGRMGLEARLALPDERALWLSPMPAEPSAAQARALAGWTARSRRDWLDGASAPNPADVFRRVCEQIAAFLDFPKDVAAGTTATLALWTVLTYLYPVFDAVPYLYVGGPLASGKSRVFEVLARLVFRPLSSSSLTGPALFRTLHDRGGTLLLDEAERLRHPGPEQNDLLAMLLAGYKRDGQAIRLEPVGETFRPVSFDVYGPKALACIKGLPPALASRCITLWMFRAAKDCPKPRRRIDGEPGTWRRLRDDLHALALSNGPAWLALPGRADVCPAMTGRAYQLWQPLLALAAYLEDQGAEGLLGLMQTHALDTIGQGQEDATPDVDETLLRLLADALREGEQPTAGDVLAKAQEADERGFRNWSARAVAEHLRRYGLTTHKIRGRKVYGQDEAGRLRKVQDSYFVDLGFSRETNP